MIKGVWAKAGDNESGDGPGYGEYIDLSDCDDADGREALTATAPVMMALAGTTAPAIASLSSSRRSSS